MGIYFFFKRNFFNHFGNMNPAYQKKAEVISTSLVIMINTSFNGIDESNKAPTEKVI